MATRRCCLCGKDPAVGFASIWDEEHGERWYCNGDDAENLSCYMQAGPLVTQAMDRIVLGAVADYYEPPELHSRNPLDAPVDVIPESPSTG